MSRSLAALLVIVTLAACSDDPSGPTASASGSIGFAYAGTVSGGGTFSATGAAPGATTSPYTQSWAASWFDQATFYVSGVRTLPNSRFDMVVIGINRSTAGTATIDQNCDPDTDANCTGFGVMFNLSQTGGTTGWIICGLLTGSATITSISSSRATGTFSGTGTCINADTQAEASFTVTNGTFDVPVIQVPVD